MRDGPFPLFGESLKLFAPLSTSDETKNQASQAMITRPLALLSTPVPPSSSRVRTLRVSSRTYLPPPILSHNQIPANPDPAHAEVNTVSEARHVVSAAKFGTKNHGTRSAPPFRLIPGVSALCSDDRETLHENLNRQAALMIQIETLEAVDNLDAILTAVPDIDAVWLGTLDIRVSMGLEAWGGPDVEPEYAQMLAKFEAVLKKHDKPRGGQALGPPEVVREMAKDNSINFIAADALALAGLAEAIPAAREMFPAGRKMVGEVEKKKKKAEVNGNGELK